MGGYLDKPNCNKEYTTGTIDDRFTFASCSMQGWRISQEDDMNCLPEFDKERNVSLFAVYDGHGGPEIARYCSLKFPDYLKSLEPYVRGDLDSALVEAFLGFDSTLLLSEVKEELKKLTEGAEDEENSEGEDEKEPVEELENLSEEAELPLEALLAKYGGAAALTPAMSAVLEKRKELSEEKDNTKSPVILSKDKRVKKQQNDLGAGGSANNGEQQAPDSSEVSNATADNQNNENLEKEAAAAKSQLKNTKSNGSETQSDGISSSTEKKKKAKTADSVEEDEEDDPEFNPEANEADDDDEEEDDSEEGSDDDDEDSSEDDDDSEEDSDDEGPGILGMLPGLMNGGESAPGLESGSTAVVALLEKNRLVVANAGDSRCVLCRADGTSEDLSIDHKPEDDDERKRIEEAGGVVTKDGRVNGGLNLSRAVGDHAYKENTDKGAKEQMIVATPDIVSADVKPGDRFVVLACDGIWNSMTSQEVCDFISERLYQKVKDDMSEEDMVNLLKEINSQLFDNCLAADTDCDGTGCDNMTCIVVFLKGATLAPVEPREAAAEEKKELTNGKKRNSEDKIVELEGATKTKRSRVENGDAAENGEPIEQK